MSRDVGTELSDQKILAVLEDGPKTANEISAALRIEVFESWARDEGVEIEWGVESLGPNEPVGARLCAIASATRRGYAYFAGYELQQRLPRMERRADPGRRSPSNAVEGHVNDDAPLKFGEYDTAEYDQSQARALEILRTSNTWFLYAIAEDLTGEYLLVAPESTHDGTLPPRLLARVLVDAAIDSLREIKEAL